MKIGIDLDTTLIKLPCIDIASEELGYKFKEQDNLDWNFSVFPENLRQRVFQMFADPDIMCNKISPIEGTQDKIREWDNKDHDIVIITARVKQIREQTLEMVSSIYPQIKKIKFVDLNESKRSVMQSENIDFWIDDSHVGVVTSIELGIPTVMISNKYTKYNWHLRNKVDWVKAVKEIDL